MDPDWFLSAVKRESCLTPNTMNDTAARIKYQSPVTDDWKSSFQKEAMNQTTAWTLSSGWFVSCPLLRIGGKIKILTLFDIILNVGIYGRLQKIQPKFEFNALVWTCISMPGPMISGYYHAALYPTKSDNFSWTSWIEFWGQLLFFKIRRG